MYNLFEQALGTLLVLNITQLQDKNSYRYRFKYIYKSVNI